MRNQSKIILTDVDGTLVDWNGAFDRYLHRRGYRDDPSLVYHYELHVRYEMDEDEMWTLIQEFNESPYIASLPAAFNSCINVPLLAEQGHRFIAITSLSDSEKAARHRRENLVKLYGQVFDEIIMLPGGANKLHTLKEWEGTGLPWVEDHPGHANTGAELGLKTYLIDAPYNKHTAMHEEIIRVPCWNRIRGS